MCFKVLLLLMSVTRIRAGFEHINSNQGYFYRMPFGPRMMFGGSNGGGGKHAMTTYITTGNSGQDLKAYASQPQEYSSANYATAEHSSELPSETTSALVAAAGAGGEHPMEGFNSPSGGYSDAAASAAAGNNAYGANSQQFLPAYASGGHEDNHISSASSDYSNAGYSLGNTEYHQHHSNGYDKFQPVSHNNAIATGQFTFGSQNVGHRPSASAFYDASGLGNALAHHSGIGQLQFQLQQAQFIPGKTEGIPLSKHVQVTKHVPVPVYKQIHVPYPKPVKIQIPHPILVPVPQPYPIKVPVSKPYAVPMVQEITIPIEKIIPYAVEKKVPYPIERHVPFPVEKHVAVHIPHPYPVKVPIVKTVLHKVKAHGWH